MSTIMSLPRKTKTLLKLSYKYLRNPDLIGQVLRNPDLIERLIRDRDLIEQLIRRWSVTLSGYATSQRWESPQSVPTLLFPPEKEAPADNSNPLQSYVEARTEGRGIMKWKHYFDMYHRHFSKFVGREVHILEIGVYSGGSLEMWRDYFGPKCRVYGVDIAEECKAYENDYTKIFVGDQADCEFWKSFREQVPTLDILIDDGGHQPEQQIITLEEMLPHLRPGGVYVCEDVHGTENDFAIYTLALAENLNTTDNWNTVDNWAAGQGEEGYQYTCSPTRFQAAISSINLYPFVVVIEKTDRHVKQFISPPHGTEWQPPSFWDAQDAAKARLSTAPPG